jgi:hypothetical protein
VAVARQSQSHSWFKTRLVLKRKTAGLQLQRIFRLPWVWVGLNLNAPPRLDSSPTTTTQLSQAVMLFFY